jgi:hypothetical protein
MFRLIFVILLCIGVWSLLNMSGAQEREEQARRIEMQDEILFALRAISDPTVNEFVDDWRKAYSKPSDVELSELREAAQRIKADKTAAAKMTSSYKMKSNPLCNGQVSTIFGRPECPSKPGL